MLGNMGGQVFVARSSTAVRAKEGADQAQMGRFVP
jgi:hypothetical protein